MKRLIRVISVISLAGIVISGCKNNTPAPDPATPEVTVSPVVTTAPESTETPTITVIPEVTDTPEITEGPETTKVTEITETPEKTETTITPEVTETPEETEKPIEGEEDMPTGKWYDKNGNAMLEFIGDKMYATWYEGMAEPEEFNVEIEKTEYDEKYIRSKSEEYGKGFGLMSYIEIMDDGTLRAYEEILDDEGHTYVFVPESRIEEERAVKDYSKDMPKTIESNEIKSFCLYLKHYSPEGLYSGNYSWEIKKKDNGKYDFKFDGMGPSYVIIRYEGEVKESYVKKLCKMIEEEGLAEHNGMFFSHDKNDSEYSLYVTYASGEKMSLNVGIKALDKWPVDNGKFMEYALSAIPKKVLKEYQ